VINRLAVAGTFTWYFVFARAVGENTNNGINSLTWFFAFARVVGENTNNGRNTNEGRKIY
jgi:hypothetical protein